MTLPLVHGPELTAPLAAWAAARIPHVGAQGFGPCWAVGVLRADDLAAVVVFHDWQREEGTVQLSAAADTPRWASRAVVGGILGMVFGGMLGAPVRCIWTATPHTNERAIKFNVGIGMTREAVLRERYAPKVHAVIHSMLEREYRKIYA